MAKVLLTQPVKVKSEMLYETIAVSLFTCLPMLVLLVACSFFASKRETAYSLGKADRNMRKNSFFSMSISIVM